MTLKEKLNDLFPPKKIKFYRQLDQMDCGPTCLKIISSHYGKLISTEFITEASGFSIDGVSINGLVNCSEKIFLKALPVKINYDTLFLEAPLPCIAHLNQRHFVVVYHVNADFVFVADPAIGYIKYSKIDFIKKWQNGVKNEDSEGVVILIEPENKFYEENDSKNNSVKKSTFRFLLPYLRPFKKTWNQLILGIILITIIQLIIPFLTQSVVDYGISYQNLNFIYIILIAQIVLFVSRTSVEIIRDWLLLHIGSRISVTILSDFLIKTMKLPVTFFESRSTGDMLQRIQDHRTLQSFLSEQSLIMIFSLLNLIVFGIVLAFFNGSIFLLYLIGTILYIVWVLLFMKKREKIDYLRFDQMSASQSNSIQILQGMTEIKLNNSEKRRRWEWEETQIKFFKVEIKNLSIFHMQRTGGTFISELKNILITFVAAKSVIDGQITLGTMLSIQYIIGQLNNPIRSLIDFILGYQNARLSLERISDIHNRENEDANENVIQKTISQSRAITIKDLSFQYKGPTSPFVLKNIDLIIPQGKTTAIVGTSGSGKTTLMKLILKFYRLESGKILVGDNNLEDMNSMYWRSNCGVVMQDGYIFNDTILRNITESDSLNPLDKTRIQEAVRIANLESFIDSLPGGYNTMLGNQGGNLSGGQRQRILIARSVYKNPHYLFFDEATSSLDANNEKIIMENLNSFFEEKTVLIIAHRLSTVKNADQIIVLDNGIVVEYGNHEKLVKQKGKYFTLVKNQLELGK